MEASGELKGDQEMLRALSTLEVNVAKKVLRNALRAGARIIESGLLAHAPVDSGLTRSAIRTRAIRRSRVGLGFVVSITSALFGGHAFYAGFVNYGWRAGRRPKGATHKKGHLVGGDKRAAKPGLHWMEKAFQGDGAVAQQVIEETMRAGLEAEIAAARTVKT